ncbi:MAG: copper resistance CopC family protein [Nocardioidaceae bacterium]
MQRPLPSSKRPVLAALLALALAGSAWLGIAPAAAHAELIGSSPTDGTTVRTLADSVSLTFGEAVSSPAAVVVKDAAGTQVQAGDPTIDGGVVTEQLSGTGAPGQYTLDYRVVSDDGHPVTGELTFTVSGGAPSTGAGALGATPSTASAADSGGSFWGRHGAQIVLAGLALVAGAFLLRVGLRARSY